jgi:microsomal dipeptidase-like Zn-dependent dipeptidase
MVADMHAHYPMHVAIGEGAGTLDAMRRMADRALDAKARTLVLRIAMRLASDRDLTSSHRISIEGMQQGNVRLGYSVLFCPSEEFDLERWGDAPEDAYFQPLLDQMQEVEDDLANWDADVARVVTDRAQLDEVLASDNGIALVHCVEGGFHLGASIDNVQANVATLADRGVAYITLAHLFFRDVATNSNALPFMSDRLYRRVFPQPRDEGLTPRGEAAVAAMAEKRIMVDVAHMSQRSIDETLDLLDSIGTDMPVIATHAGYRFGEQAYMLDGPTIERIAARDGVVGLIMAQHQLNDGLVDETETLEESFEVVCRHVDKIAELTGSHRHVALGTDFDGFVKPTMGGLESMSDLGALEALLVEKYGADAELIASGNALRVLRAAWSG